MNHPEPRFAMDPQTDVKPKAAAKAIDTAAEDAYWRDNYKHRPYAAAGSSYDEYQPAYRYGAESFAQDARRSFDEAEADLSRNWSQLRGTSSLDWDRAKHAVRDAWNRVSDSVERAMPGDSDRDGK